MNTNYGTKKTWQSDRHQQRARNRLEEELQKSSQRLQRRTSEVVEQQKKVQESEHRGHGKRLPQRQRKLVELEQKKSAEQTREEQLKTRLAETGEPKQRADRDFRKQKVMTLRTLLLENYLRLFMEALLLPLGISVSIEIILDLLFKRSGGWVQTNSYSIFWLNTEGLSGPYRILLDSLIESLNQMQLTHQGKPVQVRSREGLPDFEGEMSIFQRAVRSPYI